MVGKATSFGLDRSGFESRLGQGLNMFFEMSRGCLGPAEPPTQWTPEFFLSGKSAEPLI
jgi:hypothetical protein